MNKIFIIGLPRTGTTSISVALLEHGFKVAHTAFTKRAFELADVISDAPCFSDYKELDNLFPESKFVYLHRSLEKWTPSIQMLLHKMHKELDLKSGYLHPVLKRSFHRTFELSTASDPFSQKHLEDCYYKHQREINNYFSSANNFLSIDVSNPSSLSQLLQFLDIADNVQLDFPHLNVGKQVDQWKNTKHPNKIDSFAAGQEHRKFFDYFYGQPNI